MSITIIPAHHVSFTTYTHVLNESYRDYFVPLNMAPDQLRGRVLQDAIDLSGSCVAMDGDQAVGLGMLAHRNDRGWIGGLGVIQTHRRQGIGRRMMDWLLARARERRLAQVQLEVITQNTAAYELYRSLNFEMQRVLYVAEGRPYTTVAADTRFTYQSAPVDEVIGYYTAFHPVRNPWQRELGAIQVLASGLQGIVAHENGVVAAYALGVFRHDVIRFVDLAHTPGKASALRGLVMDLHQQFPAATGGIINVGENDPAWAVLFVSGYQPYLSQYEMVLRLR